MPQPGTRQQPLDTNEHALGMAGGGGRGEAGISGHPFWYVAGCPNPRAFAWPRRQGILKTTEVDFHTRYPVELKGNFGCDIITQVHS